MSSSAPMIEAKNVTRSYGEGRATHVVVDEVTLTVEEGEFLAIVGPSGCGKSTLLGVLGGLDRHFEGELKVCGKRIKDLSDRDLSTLRGDRIGFVFQAFHLLGHLNVRDNVMMPTLFSGRRKPPQAGSWIKRAESLLAQVGLEGRGDEAPSTLSGGERQRVSIARALLMDPPLLLCDEPTGNLDLKTGGMVIEIFATLHAAGKTIVAVTHEKSLSTAAGRVLHMAAGRLQEQGKEEAS